ncbi:NUDIX domain-containing protein (plasmid) [Streptomyces sp. HUAS TT3]|uniref:NUDIX domain-containing protein n=1 Tax=Streptomyces sp. HUAS TT3 TaxID=3447510 RepID=UPI003F65EE29
MTGNGIRIGIGGGIGQRVFDAALADARSAVVELDDARRWLAAAGPQLEGPLAAEVWVFDRTLSRVLLVRHRWRGLVPPGGRVEPGETPRQAAARELLEETGLRAELFRAPALATVRSYRPGAGATFGLSYVAVADAEQPLDAESGQPAAWRSLDGGDGHGGADRDGAGAWDWDSCFRGDRDRMRRHAALLASGRDRAASG